tara:strand:- start:2865 stop:4004 length:1140 start_codon:yes stop_codon:yes gene_type:complete
MKKSPIRIFNIKYSEADKQKINSYFNQVIEEAFLTNHTFCRKLEKKCEEFFTPYYAASCNSATGGLEVIFRYLDVKNKAVLVQSNTFIATAHAIQAAGGIIVPIDLNENYVMSTLDLKNAISECKSQSIEIGAICIVNISGLASDGIVEIRDICREQKIPFVEDNAQGMFSTQNGKYLGTFADFSVSSFQTTKVVACGEGGMIFVKNKHDYENIKNFITYGKSKDIPMLFENDSGNFKLSELNAALAFADLERSEKRIKSRQEINEFYKLNISSKFFKYINNPKGNISSNYKSLFMANSLEIRNKIEDHFKKNLVAMTGYVYKIPLHKQPRVINSLGFKNRKLEKTDLFCNTHFTPPNYPELTNDEINYVCEVMNKFVI